VIAKDYSFQKIDALLMRLNGERTKELNSSDDLFSAGALDSLRLIQLAMMMEEEYGFQFDYSDIQYESFRSIESIARLLKERYA
jgi:acyl carrier protein